MKIYVDFDGVILDTDSIIDKEYSKCKNITRGDFVKNYDWFSLVHRALQINDSLNNLRNTKYETFILSKVSSLNEGIAKVNFLRDNEVNVNIHLVPTSISKSDMVNPEGNILIDDKVYNLDEWVKNGGIGLFFNKDNNDYDVRGKKNTKYRKISNLDLLLDDDITKFI